jgi:hypothetical protein
MGLDQISSRGFPTYFYEFYSREGCYAPQFLGLLVGGLSIYTIKGWIDYNMLKIEVQVSSFEPPSAFNTGFLSFNLNDHRTDH